jgi:hypothetical protein
LRRFFGATIRERDFTRQPTQPRAALIARQRISYRCIRIGITPHREQRPHEQRGPFDIGRGIAELTGRELDDLRVIAREIRTLHLGRVDSPRDGCDERHTKCDEPDNPSPRSQPIVRARTWGVSFPDSSHAFR